MPHSYNMGYEPDEKNDQSAAVTISRTDTSNLKGDPNKFDDVELKDPNGEEEKADKKDDAEKPKSATLGEMFSYATCMDYFLILFGSLAALGHGAAWPLMMLVFGQMTNDFVNFGQNTTDSNSTTHQNKSYHDLAEEFEEHMADYAVQYVYIGIGVGVTTYMQIAFWQIACERQTYKIRLAFFKSLLRQNVGWYDKKQSGDLTTKLADDLERVREGLGDKVCLSMQFLSQCISGFVVGFVTGWKMTLVIMSLTPLIAFFAGVLGKLTVSVATLEQLSYAKAGGIAEEVLSCIRTVTSFNGHAQEIKKYTVALTKCMKLGVKKGVFAGLSIGLVLLTMFCAYGLAFWYGSTQVDEYNTSNGDEGYSPGDVITIFFSVMVGSFALGGASPHISAFLTAKGAGGTIFPIIKAKPIIDSSDPGGKKPSTIKGRIQLKNVGFTYPTRLEAKILKDFSLDIQPGQTVALVGSSGCGKSTIVNLIQRFYDPEEGAVLVDGEDIRDLNIHWLRGNIGIVSQEPILFGMTIAKNIELGHPGVTMEAIERAARMANAHNFITQLPDGYETLVGERGAQLSGGQKQRVAIARALVRDPRILLLDEATSALDSESEGIVQAALDKAGVGRTTVIIAHRMSTIQNADVIYVLNQGQVVEVGKHSELMAHEGDYYKLVTLQMLTEDENHMITDDDKAVIRRRSMKTRSDSAAKVGRQVSTDSASRGQVNLFKTKVEEKPEEDDAKDIPMAGFGRIFKANRKEWPFIVFGCFAAIINGAIFPAFALFFSEIIKTFSKKGQELLDDGLLWSMMFVGLGVVSFIVNVIQNVAFGFSGERLTHRLRSEAFTSMMRQDIVYFDDPKHSTGALTTRLATDATMIKTATGIRLAMIMQSITSMVAGMTIAFVYGWKLAFGILAGVPFIMLAGAVNMKVMKGNQLRDSSLLEEAGKTAGECVENIRTVQGLTREPYFYNFYSEKLLKPYKENVKQAHIYGISFSFSQCIFFFLYAAAYRFGAWLVVHDGMAPDLVFRVFFAITFTGMSVGQASSFLPEYAKARLSASKIFAILDTVPKIDIFSTLGITQVDQTSADGKIEVKDVHFRYPMRPDVEVLKGISLVVQPGQTAALVGMSGCGKSTIMSLLQRFYDPESGSICVQGRDVKDYNLKSLRSQISVVSQEPVLFDTSIRENILYGLEADTSMSDVIQAAKTANAHNFISQLPDGYETTVGEKGTQLSGGQKQRVAIARALIRNPKILLLDEATSALDTESEKVVQEALDHARHGRTCIVIAHRLSTVQNADIIYVVESGLIVESGTHQDLIARKGAYSVLVGSQTLPSAK